MSGYNDTTDNQNIPKTLTVKEMDPDDQPREKALRHGVQVLSTSELWAIILRTGTPGYPVTLMCREMMRGNDGKLLLLMRRSFKELQQIKGIGQTKAIQIAAVMELVKRFQNETIGTRLIIRQSKDIWEIMRHEIGNLDHEEIWVLFVNRRNEVIERQRITSGARSASIFDIRMILKPALLGNADGIIMCHNHPSGNINPSSQDDAITHQLNEGCRIFSLRMLDHVIVTTDGFYSYRDNDRL